MKVEKYLWHLYLCVEFDSRQIKKDQLTYIVTEYRCLLKRGRESGMESMNKAFYFCTKDQNHNMFS